MSALDDFLTKVRPWAPGVPDPVAYDAIRSAAIEFCERTRLWRYEDTYPVSASDAGEIFAPVGAVLHDIEAVEFDGRKLRPITTVDLDAKVPRWRTDPVIGLPEWYTQIEQNAIRIVPPQDGEVYVCLRLKPDPAANDIPDFIAREYREVIGWGALGRLLMIPGQSYSNPDMAQYYKSLFDQKIDRLSTKGTTGQQNAPKRTKSRFF